MNTDDIYENLPCHADEALLRNGNHHRGSPAAGTSASGGNEENGSGKVQNNLALNSKDMLYATPLKKSERPAKLLNNGAGGTPNGNGCSGGGGGSSVDADRDAKIINAELEDKRIRDFLKDTSQMHKKIELHKTYQSSNFSYLARKEHFADLVQRNVNNNGGGGSGAVVVGDQQGDDPDGGARDISLVGGGGSEYKTLASEEEDNNLDLDINESLNELEARCNEKLEMLTNLNRSRGLPGSATVEQRSQEDNEQQAADDDGTGCEAGWWSLWQRSWWLWWWGGTNETAIISAHLNREWVLKKIAMCLEQRIAKKPVPPVPTGGAGAAGLTSEGGAAGHRGGENGPPSLGYLVLGSNGSGKTSICNDIIEGTSGTKGMLNRRLLACYFVNSQNPECHSLSMFIRSIILQILSHSSFVTQDTRMGQEMANLSGTGSVEPNEEVLVNTSNDCLPEADQQQLLKVTEEGGESKNATSSGPEHTLPADGHPSEAPIDKELKEAIRTEMKINERVAEFCSGSSDGRKKVSRQQSEPVESLSRDREHPAYPYKTHPPPVAKSVGTDPPSESAVDEKEEKSTMSPGRPAKVSKIPIAIGSTIRSPKKVLSPSGEKQGDEERDKATEQPRKDNEEETILEGGGEAIAEGDMSDIKLEDEEAEGEKKEPTAQPRTVATTEAGRPMEQPTETRKSSRPVEKPMETSIPPPLPKSKNCRQVIADGYYEMLLSNPDIFESLTVDSIEKNPDDCFKKAILFPLLELCPPKSALLLLIDSIDENYIQDGNLISTLKGKQATKSRNIAELLSNHIHLMPKWLFMVCTAKKQNKNITKLFTGFKKLTLDDLRKSHVVKDVQQYIINRLNTDFRGINLTKDIIESLNQLYIKSNGCLLYLYKVLNGIRENFFTFREIKLIPCTLNGLYLYICQKSFNKKQYNKIRPILNVLLVCNSYVDKYFIYNCLRTHNYTLEMEDFERRLELMRNIVEYSPTNPCALRIFHNSFCDWLIDVKFSTKKFLCDLNEGHVMVSMYYTVVADQICPNKLRLYLYHLIKTGEYLTSRNVDLDLLLILLETKSNLADCFYTNLLNCCAMCEDECRNDINLSVRTKYMLERFLNGQLNDDFMIFLSDFFKPNLPTDCKVLKLLIETGINNADTALSCESSAINSPVLSDRSQNIDSELAELLISSEKSCQQELQNAGPSLTGGDGGSSALGDSKSDIQNDRVGSGVQCDIFEGEMHKGKALIHILANEGNHTLLERALNACKDPIDLEIEDLNGQTALNIAARNGHQEIVKLC
ncbi:AGAP004215-PA-like protein [Anopheles sinensis]|uniref:AGAP004215-PA-like protein n=1 Tax=Anopheles sinensis TaxID=74873 RepID=A0A084VJY2_ANOSI|nr:AGAP004215-PA-like protein [Anopheles sinensis]